MAKVADSYFKIDPWKIVEEGFTPEYAMTAESVFSLGNEYMGVRGYFEEGYSGQTLLGSYFNGVYERRKAAAEGYKGIVQETEFMVNSMDWLYLRIRAGEECLDLATAKFENFHRELDLRTGLLSRRFTWVTEKGKLEVCLERLISMVENEAAAQRVTITSNGYCGEIRVCAGLDFNTTHGAEKMSLWNCQKQSSGEHRCHISGCTKNTDIEVESSCIFRGSMVEQAGTRTIVEEKLVAEDYTFSLEDGESRQMEKIVCNVTPLAKKEEVRTERILDRTFYAIFEENKMWWEQVWQKSDVEIWGDEENQGIRFCIFQMFQTYHGAIPGTNIGAKGLTGEAYNGNAFWDTETYCLPFFLFHDRKAAANLLYFRYATLEEARNRAQALDCKGAFYPIATISGRECCNLWQHASLHTYTNADEVELLVNGKSFGIQKNKRDDIQSRNMIYWKDIPYGKGGNILAIARNNGKEVARHLLETTGKAKALKIELENADWKADGMDLQYVKVYAVDGKGRVVPAAEGEVTFEVSGEARLIAVDNGDHMTDELFSGNHKKLHQGFVMAILRSSQTGGDVKVKASLKGLKSAEKKMMTK